MQVKADKFRNLDAAELERQTQDAQEQLFRLRFQLGMGQLEGLKKYQNLRRERARMLTVLNEKRVQPAESKAPEPKRAGKK